MILRSGTGPVPAKIMLVGEAYGADEERLGEAFVGASGQELNRMLHEAQIMRSECFATNVVNSRPPNNEISAWIEDFKKKGNTPGFIPLRDKMVNPIVKQGYDQLLKEIELVKPNVIAAFGNTPMWALTGNWGITKWRGSLLNSGFVNGGPVKLIPAIHPAAVLRQWDWRMLVVNDLRRVRKHSASADYDLPAWKFIIRPTFEKAAEILNFLLDCLDAGERWLDFDIETKHGHIDCAAISWSRVDAICIPFLSRGNPEGYWSLEEEAAIVYLIYRVLTHGNARIRGQNILYDSQYTYKHWHFIPRVAQDTMISWHVAFAGLRKSLDFQASILCDHYVQWKPDKQAWKEGG